MPWIEIIDVEYQSGNDPPRFRYRLTGTSIDIVQNRNLTGTYVDEHEPKWLRDALLRSMTRIVETPKPQFDELKFTNPTGHRRRVRSLRLPLAGAPGGARVDHILVALRLF